MAKKKKIVRTPIILSPDVEYHTIVSTNQEYANATTMGVYPTLESARYNYQSDMNTWNKEHGRGNWHYAIRKVKKEDTQNVTVQ